MKLLWIAVGVMALAGCQTDKPANEPPSGAAEVRKQADKDRRIDAVREQMRDQLKTP